jgi:hypothetical protein
VLLGRLLGIGYDSPLGRKTILFMAGNTVLLAVYALWVWRGLRRPAKADTSSER